MKINSFSNIFDLNRNKQNKKNFVKKKNRDSEFVKSCHEHVIHAAQHTAMSMRKLFISIRINIVFF